MILHIGAHRTATSSFQAYMMRHRERLAREHVAFWGPGRTRRGLFAGLLGRPDRLARAPDRARRSLGLIRLEQARLIHGGFRHLVVSEENLLGGLRWCLADQALYRDARTRLARIAGGFAGRGRLTVLLGIRAYESWWPSAASMAVSRGLALPDAVELDRMACGTRRWRDVIRDVAAALPRARVLVAPFEMMAGQSGRLLERLTGLAAPRPQAPDWQNRGRDIEDLQEILRARGEMDAARGLTGAAGKWQPFDAGQRRLMRRRYAADLDWLKGGANGCAALILPSRGWTAAAARDTKHPVAVTERPDHGHNQAADMEQGGPGRAQGA